jgi:hypothetical protein
MVQVDLLQRSQWHVSRILRHAARLDGGRRDHAGALHRAARRPGIRQRNRRHYGAAHAARAARNSVGAATAVSSRPMLATLFGVGTRALALPWPLLAGLDLAEIRSHDRLIGYAIEFWGRGGGGWTRTYEGLASGFTALQMLFLKDFQAFCCSLVAFTPKATFPPPQAPNHRRHAGRGGHKHPRSCRSSRDQAALE